MNFITARKIQTRQYGFLKVLKLNAAQAEAYLFLGVLYAAEKRYSDAKEILESFLKTDPDNAMGMYYLGLINMDLEDYDKAAEYFSKVAEVRPNFDAAYLNLGVISELKGDLKQAEKHYKKAWSLIRITRLHGNGLRRFI